MEPGGALPVNGHKARPTFFRVVKGTITYHGAGEKRRFETGQVVLESGSTAHWWTNEENEAVVLHAVDISISRAGRSRSAHDNSGNEGGRDCTACLARLAVDKGGLPLIRPPASTHQMGARTKRSNRMRSARHRGHWSMTLAEVAGLHPNTSLRQTGLDRWPRAKFDQFNASCFVALALQDEVLRLGLTGSPRWAVAQVVSPVTSSEGDRP